MATVPAHMLPVQGVDIDRKLDGRVQDVASRVPQTLKIRYILGEPASFIIPHRIGGLPFSLSFGPGACCLRVLQPWVERGGRHDLFFYP